MLMRNYVVKRERIMGKKSKISPPFSPINTGQVFPPGTHTRRGTCDRCGRHGDVADMQVRFPIDGMTDALHVVCPECLADNVAGAPVVGTVVSVRRTDGKMYQVSFSPPSLGALAAMLMRAM